MINLESIRPFINGIGFGIYMVILIVVAFGRLSFNSFTNTGLTKIIMIVIAIAVLVSNVISGLFR